ncbi:MAG: type VI secretion system baseplate subunit TssF [Pseudomonadota bacterium]
MDTRLLNRYEQELRFIREMGAEFAEAYPKIASRLGIEGLEVLDPYVERLLEGFAFLSARVQLELDLQYPVFTQNLFELVYPHYLAPTPSMMIARLKPDPAQGIDDGFTLARGTTLRSRPTKGDGSAVRYRTSQDVTLWPIEIAEVEYLDSRGELVAAGIAHHPKARAAIRLRLRRDGGLPIAALPLDRLTLFLSGSDAEPWALYEALSNETLDVIGRSTDRRADWTLTLPRGALAPRGFDPEEALLPTPGRSFDGYRLVQEYFALPQRFFFLDLKGLAPVLARAPGDAVDIYILLSETHERFKGALTPASFELFATPAINLFEKRCDRVTLRKRDIDHHVVVDRTAPMDFEVYAITSVTGITPDDSDDVDFRPFFSADDLTAVGEGQEAYYMTRRRLRQRNERQRLQGTRTSYLGSDHYLTLVDRAQAPYGENVAQLAVKALCTNRDLPLMMSLGGSEGDFTLPEGGPVSEVRAIVSPTRPRSSAGMTEASWRLVSHLSLNYLSIADADRGEAAAALREMLGLYVPPGDRALARQVEGIVAVESRPIVRRLADGVLTTAVRGIEIRVTFDESAYEGAGVYAMGAVLERFFARYVTINSFTETVLVSEQRGEVIRFAPRSGTGPLL